MRPRPLLRQCLLVLGLAAPLAAGAGEAPEERSARHVPPEACVLFSEGVALQLQGKHAEAIARLEAALKLDPSSPAILYEIGYCHYRQGKGDKAAEFLKRSLALDPENGPAHQTLAFVHAAAMRRDEALQELEAAARAKRRPPRHERLVRQIALTYQRQGDRKKAIEWYQFLIDCGYRRTDAYLSLGTLQLQEKLHVDALDSFRHVVRRTASDRAAAVGIARAFAALSEDERNEAIRRLEAAAGDRPGPDTSEVLAMAYKAAGRQQDMLRALEAAARAGSRRATTQKLYLAEYYEQLGHFAKAIEWRQQLIAEQATPPAEAHVRLAGLHVKHQALEKAAAAYRKALAAEPTRRDLLRRIADCHAELYQWEPAIAALEEFLGPQPTEPARAPVVYELGELYRQAGKPKLAAARKKLAFDLLTRAIGSRDPQAKLNDVHRHLLLAELHYADDKPQKALEYILIAQRLDPDDPRKLLLVAAAHKRVQDWTAATEAYRQFLAKDSKSLAAAGTLFELGRCQEIAGDLAASVVSRERAKKLLLQAYRATDNDAAKAALQAQLGETEMRRNQPKAAIERFLDAVRLNPRESILLVYLAQCYEMLGDWARAAAYYKSCLDALDGEPDPDDARRIHRLGVAQTRSGQPTLGKQNKARAIQLLTSTLDTLEKEHRGSPATKAQLLRDLAGLHATDKQYSKAIAAIRKAIALAPEGRRTDYNLVLASIYDEMTRYRDSERLLVQAHKQEPDNPAVLNHLGYFYAERRKKLDQAVKLVQKALHYDPLNGAYIDSLGWAYYQQGKHKQALDLLLRAVEHEEDAVIRDHVGDAYHKLGKTNEARQAWLRALTLDPDIQGVAEKLKRTQPKPPPPPPKKPPAPKAPDKPKQERKPPEQAKPPDR